jgi:hypothetical protein
MYKRDDLDRPIGRPNTIVPKEGIPWIWEGVLAEEAITLLSAPEKIGKTTLLSLRRAECRSSLCCRSLDQLVATARGLRDRRAISEASAAIAEIP